MALIPDLRESEVVKKSKEDLFLHLEKRRQQRELDGPVKLPRLKKEFNEEEINELKQIKIKLRAIIDGLIDGPMSEYEHKRQHQLEKKYKYHRDYLMW